MKTVTVSGTSVSRIAAKELGDARQWARIMEANGFFDAVVRAPSNVKIPERDANAPTVPST
ncbi:hypothetical protein [Brevundimonas sp.]|uniref:hypothetical protein n=1 Tax=Brevundimonas sp. TaxID=1871086 RepID=UPI0028AE44A2|nr:hypothetical protein [Brevundimonas sp.]